MYKIKWRYEPFEHYAVEEFSNVLAMVKRKNELELFGKNMDWIIDMVEMPADYTRIGRYEETQLY